MEKVAELMAMRPDTVPITLAKGLQKLQKKLTPQPAGAPTLPVFL